MHRLLYKGSDVVVNATEIRFLDVVCVELRVRNKNDEQLEKWALGEKAKGTRLGKPRDMNVRARGRDLNAINSEEVLDGNEEQVFFPGNHGEERVCSKVFGLRKDVLI